MVSLGDDAGAFGPHRQIGGYSGCRSTHSAVESTLLFVAEHLSLYATLCHPERGSNQNVPFHTR